MCLEGGHNAQNEDAQSNGKTVQDYGQGQAAQAQDQAQPPAPQKIETGSPEL
jgi:hypothetical protein